MKIKVGFLPVISPKSLDLIYQIVDPVVSPMAIFHPENTRPVLVQLKELVVKGYPDITIGDIKIELCKLVLQENDDAR